MLKGFMIMPEKIVRQLELFKVDKAPGPDELHPRIKKETASKALAEIFDSSPRTGWFKRTEGKEGLMQFLYLNNDQEEIQEIAACLQSVGRSITILITEKHILLMQLCENGLFSWIRGKELLADECA